MRVKGDFKVEARNIILPDEDAIVMNLSKSVNDLDMFHRILSTAIGRRDTYIYIRSTEKNQVIFKSLLKVLDPKFKMKERRQFVRSGFWLSNEEYVFVGLVDRDNFGTNLLLEIQDAVDGT